MRDFGLTDSQLFPLLTEQGDQMLRRLREHPHAPRYNWRNGERLTTESLENVRAYGRAVKVGPASWKPGGLPPWVMPYVRKCRAKVPFYRDRSNWPENDEFGGIPLTRRDDIRRHLTSFVPDDLPLDDLVVYTTSGTTGSRLKIPAVPELPSRYLPLMELALAKAGVHLEGGNRVSIVQVCAQVDTVVQCSLSTYFGGAGFVKVNLHPSDWKDPADVVPFLDDCNAELYTGDPFALWRLSQLPLKHRPKAIISSGTALSAGQRRTLISHFDCPVIDMYSMNESGPVGFSTEEGAHEILQPELYVEIVDESGQPSAPGTIGQIVLTGGLNPYLPLVRYATGDFAALDFSQGVPRLINLHGRPPVAFRNSAGEWFNSIDISTALGRLSLPRLSLHQRADGSLLMRVASEQPEVEAAADIIRRLFGISQALEIERKEQDVVDGKPINFGSDLGAAHE